MGTLLAWVFAVSGRVVPITDRRDVAVLILHGLTGTPLDVRPITDALVADGYTVSAPLLPGRGTRPADMDQLSWEDWMAAAVGSYDDLAHDHRRVVVGGLSAGGTMALDLALRRRPAALLLFGTALAMANRFAYVTPYIWRFIRCWPSPASDMVDLNAGAACYDPVPLRAVAELIAGISRVRGRLPEITCPALVAHAIDDRLVPVAYARDLAVRLGGPVWPLFLEGTGHAITVDVRRDEVAAASVAFLRDALEAPARRTA